MSRRHEIKDRDNVEMSDDGTEIEVLFKSDTKGNHYVDIPIKFIKEKLDGHK